MKSIPQQSFNWLGAGIDARVTGHPLALPSPYREAFLAVQPVDALAIGGHAFAPENTALMSSSLDAGSGMGENPRNA